MDTPVRLYVTLTYTVYLPLFKILDLVGVRNSPSAASDCRTLKNAYRKFEMSHPLSTPLLDLSYPTMAKKSKIKKDHMVSTASGWDPLEIKEGPGSKYAITGNESQVLTIALRSGETCKGEPSSMMYLTSGVSQAVSCDGFFDRCLSGESCCVLNFTNEEGGPGYAALTPSDPLGKVIPVDLSDPSVGGSLIAQQGTYMAHYGDVSINFDCDCNFMRCCCGGAGLVRQKIEGSGTVFLGATGTIVQKVLAPGEVMVMDTNCILAFSNQCKLDIKKAGGLVGMIGGGEGIFNTTLTGPGLAIVQSMNKTLFLGALAANKIYRR